jgi:sugar O-acyltransferase (sialic acid O-acetyltransferase NeuD family)
MSICIIGCGGFGREVAETIERVTYKRPVFAVDDEYMNGGMKTIRISEITDERLIVAVGDPIIRKKLVERLPDNFFSVVHDSAILGTGVQYGKGTVIQAGCVLTCNISLGDHCQLNLYTTIGHDCKIGDYFTSAPGVNISGNVTIGECVYIGTNACIREKVTICDNVIIGMGSVVIKDITEHGTYVGNPIRKIK